MESLMRKVMRAAFAAVVLVFCAGALADEAACNQCITRYNQCLKDGGAALNCQAKRDNCFRERCP